jgi:RNA polymerase sigma factor (TIGR02999 family)
MRKRGAKTVISSQNGEIALGLNRTELDYLFSVTYEELRRLAASVRSGDPAATLNPTALVNEAWLKLANSPRFVSTSRLHFKRIAARAMRQLLVESARRRQSQKRRGEEQAVFVIFDESAPLPVSQDDDVLRINSALDELTRLNPRQALMVESRFFGGLEVNETAELLEVSEATILRDWRAAKAWLAQELRQGRSGKRLRGQRWMEIAGGKFKRCSTRLSIDLCPSDSPSCRPLPAVTNGSSPTEDGRVSLLDDGIAPIAGRMFDQRLSPSAPSCEFGPYRIREVIGEGGMGVVYLAVRDDLGSLAAIKLLRDAWMSPARRERFATEQRTLARLTHPSIARLYDADTLPDGTPWFAMEFVRGVPLTEYCRQHGSSIVERLKLFGAVCEAVRYAHSRAVIHRDLKPGNILVQSDGSVKLLDFGIAKQLDRRTTPENQTRTGLRLMTLAYAAPEQIRGEPAGTYTDVYALGVILYELLTGQLPFDQPNRSPGEAEAAIIGQEPTKPSFLARRSTANERDWADLDVLCLTAMHKDPERRYRSAEALIRDIDHYVLGEPLDARPDTLRYRVGKYIRRNRRSVAAVALALAAIAGLVIFYTVRLAAARNAALAEAAHARNSAVHLESF